MIKYGARRTLKDRHLFNLLEILFDNREKPCIILYTSFGGAKVETTKERKIKYPRTDILDITPLGRFTVTVVWHSGELLGGKFLDARDTMAEVPIAMAVY